MRPLQYPRLNQLLFLAPGPVAIVLATLGWMPVSAGAVLAAGLILVALVAGARLLPWRALRADWQAAIPMSGLVVPALLIGGNQAAGVSPFVLLAPVPVVWVALYHDRRLAWWTAVAAGVSVAIGATLAGDAVQTGAGTAILIFTVCGLGVEMTHRLLHAEREANDALRAVRDQQREIFNHLPDTAILVIDPTYRIVSVEGGKLGGNAPSREDVLGKRLEDIIPADRLAPYHDTVDAALAGETLQIDHRGVEHPADFKTDVMPLRDADGAIVAAMCVMRDVTAHKTAEARLRHLASHDDLTGLWNRRRFAEAVRDELSRVRRHEQDAALLLIDLDAFKGVNDRFGHAAGDRLLIAVADAIRGRLRASDHAGRLGGDEFAVLLHGIGAADAERVAAEFRAAISAATIRFGGVEVSVSASVGAAAVGPETLDEEALMARADAAMYAEEP